LQLEVEQAADSEVALPLTPPVAAFAFLLHTFANQLKNKGRLRYLASRNDS